MALSSSHCSLLHDNKIPFFALQSQCLPSSSKANNTYTYTHLIQFPSIRCSSSFNHKTSINLRTCKNCKTQFDPSLNHPHACRFHTAHYGAYDVWQDLKNRFCQGDSVRIFQLRGELCSLKQGDISVTAYFTKLKIVCDEFCNFRPLPSCESSDSGSCNILRPIQQFRDNDCVMSFLEGLNDNYAAIKSHILLVDPLPPLHKVFSMVSQQERQLQIALLPDPTILAASSQSLEENSQTTNAIISRITLKHCTHCGRTNHTVDNCFFKHGFPPGYKSKKALMAATNEPGPPISMVPGLTPEQLQGLLALLPQYCFSPYIRD